MEKQDIKLGCFQMLIDDLLLFELITVLDFLDFLDLFYSFIIDFYYSE